MTLFSIFRIPRSWLRIKCRNERRARNSAHGHDHCNRWSFLCTQLSRVFFSLFFFLFFVRLGYLEASCKFQRALHSKKEDRSDPKICCEESYNEWLPIFWIFFGVQRMGSHCYYYITVLVSVVIVVMLIVYLHADPSSWSSYRGKFVILLISVAIVVYKSFVLN